MRSPPWFKASPPGTSSSLSTPFQSTSLQVYLPPVPLECAVSGCLAHTSWHSPTKPSLSSHSCWWRTTPELCFSSLLCGTSLYVIRNRKKLQFPSLSSRHHGKHNIPTISRPLACSVTKKGYFMPAFKH